MRSAFSASTRRSCSPICCRCSNRWACELNYKAGEGPVFANPVRSAARRRAADRRSRRRRHAVHRRDGAPDSRTICRASAALIGFAGAPFTLASYAIEGRGSRNYIWVKKMMYGAPQLWDALMTKLVDTVADYVRLQIDAGVDAVQLFDSWIGCLSVRRLPALRRAVQQRADRPYRGARADHLFRHRQFSPRRRHVRGGSGRAGARLAHAAARDVGSARLHRRAGQSRSDRVVRGSRGGRAQTQAILDEVAGRHGHIFNLGHGIVPETPVDNVKYLVDLVHERRRA